MELWIFEFSRSFVTNGVIWDRIKKLKHVEGNGKKRESGRFSMITLWFDLQIDSIQIRL